MNKFYIIKHYKVLKMKRNVINLVLLSFVVFSSHLCFCQAIPNEILSKKIVVEGEVVSQKFRYRNVDKGLIETLNFIKVKKKLKDATVTDTIIFLTNGGIMQGFLESSSHSPKLVIGQKGLFAIDKYEIKEDKFISNFDIDNNIFINYNTNLQHACDLFSKNLFTQMAKKPNEFQNSTLNTSKEFCIKIENIIPNFTSNTISFDILGKSNQQGIKLSEVNIKVKYPKRNLGDYIVNNVKIEAQKSTILLDNIYQLDLSDFTDTIVEINVLSDCIIPSTRSNYYELDTIFENLLSLTLKVSNWGFLGDLTLEDFQFEGTAKFINETNSCEEFDDLCVENGSFQLGFCDIFQAITGPFGAGVQQEITFKGLNYGTTGKIEIPNADDGGATNITINSTDTRWVKLWSDTEIKVLISSIAPDHPMGSGKWIIKPTINLGCHQDIEIEYAISNTLVASNTERMNSIATNTFSGNDKFKWYIDKTAIETNSFLAAQGITYLDVYNVCNQAFCDWELASGLEFNFEGDNPNGSSNDQKYTVTIGSLGGSILANTSTEISIGLCDLNTDPFIDGRLRDADIIIDENQPWFVSLNTPIPSTKYDLYSVMIHEIGHMLLMYHANQGTMFYSTSLGANARNIDTKLLNGIEVQKNRTLVSLNGCLNGYALNTSISGCTTSTYENFDKNTSLLTQNIFLQNNPTELNFKLEIDEVLVFDFNSNLLYKNVDKSHIFIINYLHSGVYIIRYRIGNKYFNSKFVVL